MVVALIGGLGFLGTHLAAASLKRGHTVWVADRNSTHKLGLLDAAYPVGSDVLLAAKAGRVHVAELPSLKAPLAVKLVTSADIAFILVGQSGAVDAERDPLASFRANVEEHVALLAGLAEAGKRARLVLASSRLVYGRPARSPVDERQPIQPVDVYGLNKAVAEMYYQFYLRRFRFLEVLIARIANPYGPMPLYSLSKPHNVLTKLIVHACQGKPVTLFGGGGQLRDYMFAPDTAEALLSLGERGQPGIWNVGSGRGSSLRDALSIAKKLMPGARISASEWPESYKQIETGDSVLDIRKLTSLIGEPAPTNLQSGVELTVRWAKSVPLNPGEGSTR